MALDLFFYNCSREYVESVDGGLLAEISRELAGLPKCDTQSDLNKEIFKRLVMRGWAYDSLPAGLGAEMDRDEHWQDVRSANDRKLCLTTTTLGASWHCDFAREFEGKLVQVEAQFGKVESMFKDFCGFQIAYQERRLDLGIEIVMINPTKYFAHRLKAISGMAHFGIAQRMLPSIQLSCPILVVGIR